MYALITNLKTVQLSKNKNALSMEYRVTCLLRKVLNSFYSYTVKRSAKISLN